MKYTGSRTLLENFYYQKKLDNSNKKWKLDFCTSKSNIKILECPYSLENALSRASSKRQKEEASEKLHQFFEK